MILDVYAVKRVIQNFVGEFDDSIYIIKFSSNKIILSINSMFDCEGLIDELTKAFPQGDFDFVVIALDMIISWEITDKERNSKEIRLFNLKQMRNEYLNFRCYPRPTSSPYDDEIAAIKMELGE